MPANKMTDEELLTKYLETKDHELFAVIDERMRPRLYALGMRLTASPDDAEDAVQDTLIRLIELEPREFYPPADNFLFRILQNLFIDKKRLEGRRVENDALSLDAFEHPELVQDDADYAGGKPRFCEPPDKSSILSEAQSRALDLQMEAKLALEELPRTQRDAVELYHCRGMTASETAAILGINETTVEKRVENGITKLRKALGVKAQPHARPVRATNANGEVVHEFARVRDARQAGYNLKSLYRSLKKGSTYRGLNWSYATAV